MKNIKRSYLFLFYILFFAAIIGCKGNSEKKDVSSTTEEIKFDHYGLFVKAKTGFVELKGYQFEGVADHFQGSNVNNTITIDIDKDKPLEFWVYSKTKTGDFNLLTDLKSSNGEYVCCFNCGSYSANPSRVCKTVDVVEKPTKIEDCRLFETEIKSGVYCFMSKESRKGYIFKVN